MTNWLDLPQHRAWLQVEGEALLTFGIDSPQEGLGAAWLDAAGRPDLTRPAQTWITCRMVHVYALGHLLGVPGCHLVAQRALSGLKTQLHDTVHGGWHHSAEGTGEKTGYDHAFVILASSSATVAGLADGQELLHEALHIFEERFWEEDSGLIVDSTSTDFSTIASYRGLNANMHAAEALLGAFDATHDHLWLQRAERIARFAIGQAAANRWRLPEHYDQTWSPRLDYNIEHKNDQFRPYGATPGHSMEWARLALHLEAALGTRDPFWLTAARALYQRAVSDGWVRDGFIYTTDWDGQPVVSDRLHWVAAEAIGAAAALAIRTGEAVYLDDYARWWENITTHFIDTRLGSWFHQLGPTNEPCDTIWPGKPDLYHAFQATLIPRLPLAPSMAKAVAGGLLRG